MQLIPYEDFEIDANELYRFKKGYAALKVYEYHKKNGTYPDSETTLSFYDIPDDVLERRKRHAYSRHYLKWKNEYDHYEEFIIDFDADYSKIPFTIQALGSGRITYNLPNSTAKYSVNGGEWKVAGKDGITVDVNETDRVSFVDVNWGSNLVQLIQSTVDFNVFGNIMSLTDGYAFPGAKKVNTWGLYSVFSGNLHLISAKNLVLPATKLKDGCYQMMFMNCKNLVSAPSILPANKLSKWCYSEMFQGCDNLIEAPVLPAIELNDGSYSLMFDGCRSLNFVKALFISIDADIKPSSFEYPIYGWLRSVATNGTLIKNERATWDIIGENGVPEGWTVETTSE